MASRQDILAGRAAVELKLKDSEFYKGLNRFRSNFTALGTDLLKIGTAITAAGVTIITPILAAVRHFAAAGDALDKMSQRTGLSVQSLAELKFAAERSGASIEAIEKAVQEQQKRGITKTFDEMAASIAAIEDSAERTKAAFAAWGEFGVKLLPMLANLQQLRAEANRRGLVPSEKSVKAAARINDAIGDVKATALAAFYEIGNAVTPLLLPILEMTQRVLKFTRDWIAANGRLFRLLLVIGVSLVAIGSAVTAVAVAFLGLAAAITIVNAAIAAMDALLAIAAAILSPLLLIGAAVLALAALLVGAAVAWVYFTESGRRQLRIITDGFAALLKTVEKTLGGIVDAILAGDIELAWKIVLAGMELAWHEFIAMIARTIAKQVNDIRALWESIPRAARVAALGLSKESALTVGLRAAGEAANAGSTAAAAVASAAEGRLNELRKKAADKSPLGPGRSPQDYPDMGATVHGFNPAAIAAAGFGRTTVHDRIFKTAQEQKRLLEQQLELERELHRELTARGRFS